MHPPCRDPTHIRNEIKQKCVTCERERSREYRRRNGPTLMRKRQRDRLYSQLLREWQL